MPEQAPSVSESRPATRTPPGPRPVFAEVYAEHFSAVYGYLRARVLDANDADDLCQEVFLRAYDNLHRFRPGAPVRPWLMGIGHNVLLEHIRRVHRRKETQWTELCLELEQIAGDANPFDDVVGAIPRCLEQLGDSAQNAIRWHYMGGQRIDAIAQQLQRTVGAVKVLMVRARQAIKRCLQQRSQGAVP